MKRASPSQPDAVAVHCQFQAAVQHMSKRLSAVGDRFIAAATPVDDMNVDLHEVVRTRGNELLEDNAVSSAPVSCDEFLPFVLGHHEDEAVG